MSTTTDLACLIKNVEMVMHVFPFSNWKTHLASSWHWLCYRILQHSGVYPDYDKESADLAKGRPNVKNVTLLLSDWWGSGIVHAKVWISDGKDIYIGSANNDWKSLTQVLYCIHSIKAPFNQYFISLRL